MCYAQSKPTNGLVLELEKFRSKNSLPFHVLGTCLRRLAGQADTSGILLPALSKKVDKLKLQQAKLRKKPRKSATSARRIEGVVQKGSVKN